MNPWIISPPWQNFSSMYREAVTAKEVATGVELSHHLTASLYFAVAALEAFINQQTREHLSASRSDEEIYKVLRYGRLRGNKSDSLIDKLAKWPEIIIGKKLDLRSGTMDSIALFNEVRSDLTHPKTHGHDVYHKLESVDPAYVVDAVAEYIGQFHSAQGTLFPYWLWGWNYLNPRPGAHEIMLVNNQQFVHSMAALGFRVNSWSAFESEAWQKRYLAGYDGYHAVAEALVSIDRCEPKFDRFPFQPKLCRRWWTKDHQQACGNVTREAIDYAMNYRPNKEGGGN